GDTRLSVRHDPGGAPMVPARLLARALDGRIEIKDGWVVFTVAQQPFRLLIDAPVFTFQGILHPMPASAGIHRDTLYVPYQFAVEVLPDIFSERYRYDAASRRLMEAGTLARAEPEPARLPNGLLPGHVVTIDPGHGGDDPGNPGIFFPRGVREKDAVLQIGLALRKELQERGITVRMTRTRDTLIALRDRGGYCTEDCDLFISLHVNSLRKRRGYTEIRGFETYLLAEAKTEEARRVARMENDAVRFETGPDAAGQLSALEFILKDLQLNEHLRESARLAELVQRNLDPVHSGDNRGVKQAGFMVLTTARRPAVLVEMGFSTNREDGRLLTSSSGQRALAAALADAIVEYLLEYERKTSRVPLRVGGPA
ncbi:MAG: N-acetylmuramoyl-L-alanine amidase family protein, partial [Gemmatimonadales bacterium]